MPIRAAAKQSPVRKRLILAENLAIDGGYVLVPNNNLFVISGIAAAPVAPQSLLSSGPSSELMASLPNRPRLHPGDVPQQARPAVYPAPDLHSFIEPNAPPSP